MFDFENLTVYKKSMSFANEIYKVSANFPKKECFGLTDQLRRASVSIAANIAEGNGRYSRKEYIQFLRIAKGSAYECVPLLEVALGQKYLEHQEFRKLYEELEEISKMLNGLINSMTKKLKEN
ncbi:MAG: four helix bundle protein [Elusimicrobiota bacterium]